MAREIPDKSLMCYLTVQVQKEWIMNYLFLLCPMVSAHTVKCSSETIKSYNTEIQSMGKMKPTYWHILPFLQVHYLVSVTYFWIGFNFLSATYIHVHHQFSGNWWSGTSFNPDNIMRALSVAQVPPSWKCSLFTSLLIVIFQFKFLAVSML